MGEVCRVLWAVMYTADDYHAGGSSTESHHEGNVRPVTVWRGELVEGVRMSK